VLTCDVIFKPWTFCRRRVTQGCRPTQRAKLFACAHDNLFSTLACACSVLLETHEFRRFPVYIHVMALWYYDTYIYSVLAGVHIWCHFQDRDILSSSSDARLSRHPARKTFWLCLRQIIFDTRMCMFRATQDTRVPTFSCVYSCYGIVILYIITSILFSWCSPVMSFSSREHFVVVEWRKVVTHPARKTFCLCPRQFIFDTRMCMFKNIPSLVISLYSI